MEELERGKRLNIQVMLANTAKLEYPNAKPGQILIRYYRMTKEEYQTAKEFCLIVLIGNIPSKNTFTEGYCYDVRTLLRERYFTLDGKISHLPIPLSVKRWNQLIETVAKDQFKMHYREIGSLEYPLSHKELISIFERMPMQPIICSYGDVCSISSESELGSFELIHLFDASNDNRFGAKKKEKAETIVSLTKQEMDKRTVMIITEVKRTLQEIEILTPQLEARIESQETREYIQSMQLTNLLDHQIVSFLVDDSIKVVLSKYRNAQ